MNSATTSRPRKTKLSSSLPSPPTSPKSQSPTLISQMRRSLIRPFLVTLLAISLLVLYLYPPLTRPSPDLSLRFSRTAAGAPTVYLYDLPFKFTYGVIQSYAVARGSSPPSDPTALKYPGHQHSAEWFLFSDLLRADRPGSPVRRVYDPEEADFFYVPFFSSLSLIVKQNRPAAGGEGAKEADYSDEEMQEELMEWLEESKYWKRNNGRDHVFIAQDPNALYKVIDRVRNGILLVSDFGRLKGDQASLVKDVILPYTHRIDAYRGEIGVEKRETLLFFMGNRYRKEVAKYFEYDDPDGTVNEIWRQVSSKLPLIKLMINRDRRLVGSQLEDPDCSCICTRRNGTTI